MIRCFHGLPRGGKSYRALLDLIDELTHGQRNYSGDLPVKWPELNAYLQSKGTNLSKQYPDVLGRCRTLTREEAKEFWRYPAPGLTISVDNTKDRLPLYPDGVPVTPHGTLYIIDEAHLKFDSRQWMKTGNALTFYLAQHAKLNDEIIFITQHLSKLESRIRNDAEQFVECNNTVNRKVYTYFRRPAKLETFTRYKCPPAPIDASTSYQLDKEIAACYDTMQGDGIKGRTVPETRRLKGIPAYWLIVPAILLAYLLTKAPEWAGHAVSGMISKYTNVKPPNDAPKAATPDSGKTRSDPASAGNSPNSGTAIRQSPLGQSSSVEGTGRIYLTSVVYTAKLYTIRLSDGTVLDETDSPANRRRTLLTRNGLWYLGRFYPRLLPVSRVAPPLPAPGPITQPGTPVRADSGAPAEDATAADTEILPAGTNDAPALFPDAEHASLVRKAPHAPRLSVQQPPVKGAVPAVLPPKAAVRRPAH